MYLNLVFILVLYSDWEAKLHYLQNLSSYKMKLDPCGRCHLVREISRELPWKDTFERLALLLTGVHLDWYIAEEMRCLFADKGVL